jgi:hypothetical protein
VRVLPDDVLQGRLPLIQIVVFQQEDVLDISLGDLEGKDRFFNWVGVETPSWIRVWSWISNEKTIVL